MTMESPLSNVEMVISVGGTQVDQEFAQDPFLSTSDLSQIQQKLNLSITLQHQTTVLGISHTDPRDLDSATVRENAERQNVFNVIYFN